MKKNFIRILFLSILILAFSACASSSGSDLSTNLNNTQEPVGEDFANQILPQPIQLAIGTLKLEETNYAVQPDQAAALLPLWQAYYTLSISSTAAQVEVEAVLGQIEESMTADQLNAIDGMQLTNASLSDIFQSLGIETNFGRQGGFNGTPNPELIETMQARGGGFQGRRGAEFAPGTGPEDGAGPGGGFGGAGLGGTPDPEMMATRQAMAGGFAGLGRLNPALFQALIDLLESKTVQ